MRHLRTAPLLASLSLTLALTAGADPVDPSEVWQTTLSEITAESPQPIENDLPVPPMKSGNTVPLKEVEWDQIESLRLLGHANMPLKLLMVLDSSTLDEAQGVYDVVRAIHRDQEARGVPSNERLRLHLVCGNRNNVNRLEITPEDFADIVEVDQWFSTTDIWMQDWGEVAAAKLVGADKERTMIVDSRRGRGSRPSPEPSRRGLKGLPDVLARLWNANLVRGPRNGGKGNYGGNIEVTPDDVLVIGDKATQSYIDRFAAAGYQDSMVVVESNWLVVGHVDEYMSTIPVPETELGYVLVKADPTAALEHLAGLESDAWRSELEGFVRAAFREYPRFPGVMGDRWRAEDLYETLVDMRTSLTGRGDGNQDDRGSALVQLNRKAAEIIDRNVEKVRSYLQARHGGKMPVQVVSFPGLFRSSGGRQVALTPGVANMIVLPGHLIIPDPLLPGSRASIEGAVQPLGYEAHFVPDLTYHFMHGQLHCGTNAFRHPNRYIHERYLRERKARQLSDR